MNATNLEGITNVKGAIGRSILDYILDELVTLTSIHGALNKLNLFTSIKEVTSIEAALFNAILGGEVAYKQAIEYIENEVKKGKVIWGSLGAYIAIMHYSMFIKKDIKLAEVLYELLANTINKRHDLSPVDEILGKIMTSTFEYYVRIRDTLKNLGNLRHEDKRIIGQFIKNACDDIRNLYMGLNELLVRLVGEVLVAELGWNNVDELEKVLDLYDEYEANIVKDEEIINEFLIIRDDLEDRILKYFHNRAKQLYKRLSSVSQECNSYKKKKKECEDRLASLEKRIHALPVIGYILHCFEERKYMPIINLILLVAYTVLGLPIGVLPDEYKVVMLLLKNLPNPWSLIVSLLITSIIIFIVVLPMPLYLLRLYYRHKIKRVNGKMNIACTYIDLNTYYS